MLCVKEQYSRIASDFSKTRYKKWNCVNNFLNDIIKTDKILELGCGKGEYTVALAKKYDALVMVDECHSAGVVGETGRGDTVVDLIRETKPDLAILDIKMPGADGLQAARVINAERLCGVLMLTAFSQREVVEEARDAGALAFLVKPFQKSDLIPAIEVAMGRFRELRSLTGEIDALGEQLLAVMRELEVSADPIPEPEPPAKPVQLALF